MPDLETFSPLDVVIVGGGLAGLAAAWALAEAGLKVTLLEARPQLGGRATSYVDRQTGEVIDNCQHVSMGCCTNLRHLCEQLGIATSFRRENKLHFIAPNGRLVPFASQNLPAPFHLLGAFWRLPYLSLSEKLLFARAVRTLARSSRRELQGVNFEAWLRKHGQTENLIRNAWELVLVSALSESLDRIDAAYARKVFVDGFLAHRSAWEVEIPIRGLDELYSQAASERLKSLGVDIRMRTRVEHLDRRGDLLALTLREGDGLLARDAVLAVPQHQIEDLLPENEQLSEARTSARRLEAAPITSVHLWFDREITDLPHAVFVDRLSQWLFARGETHVDGKRAWLFQIVISASRGLKGREPQEVIEAVRAELAAVWPGAKEATLLHSRLITERRAVFSVTPGVDAWRPPQQTGWPELQLAGDWTRTGWPSTMEGAVRSGLLAAENVLRRRGRGEGLLQPDLPVSWASRWLLGVKPEVQTA